MLKAGMLALRTLFRRAPQGPPAGLKNRKQSLDASSLRNHLSFQDVHRDREAFASPSGNPFYKADSGS